jgi:uncharacterized protein
MRGSRVGSVALCAGGFLALGNGPVAAQIFMPDTPNTPHVMAGAVVQLPVPADRAVVNIALSARESSGPSAVRELAAFRGRVVAALAEIGIPAQAVVPWGYGYGTSMPPIMGRPPAPPEFDTGERVARQGVRVVVERLDQLEAVLTALADADVDAIPFVQFEATETAEARQQAAARAVADARGQAESMARAAGGRLGELLSLTTMPDFTPGFSGVERAMSMGPGMDRTVQLVPSDVSVRVMVRAAWRFVPN